MYPLAHGPHLKKFAQLRCRYKAGDRRPPRCEGHAADTPGTCCAGTARRLLDQQRGRRPHPRRDTHGPGALCAFLLFLWRRRAAQEAAAGCLQPRRAGDGARQVGVCPDPFGPPRALPPAAPPLQPFLPPSSSGVWLSRTPASATRPPNRRGWRASSPRAPTQRRRTFLVLTASCLSSVSRAAAGSA